MNTNYFVHQTGCEEACDHCTEVRPVHLGKAVSGKEFLFRAQPEWFRLLAFECWFKLASSGQIFDDDGCPVSLSEMLGVILGAKSCERYTTHQVPDGSYRVKDCLFTPCEFL